MNMRLLFKSPMVLTLTLAFALVPASAAAHGADKPAERLARIGPAADFTLTNHDGTELSMAELRGKVVAMNFIFTRCVDVCPIATAKMVGIQRKLGAAFGEDVYFVSVTVDPQHDTPERLAGYARALGCDTSGWAFLTGSAKQIHHVARSYGVFHDQLHDGQVSHSLLTSLVDREGTLRVQYMGERFDPDELLHDLRDLVAEGD